MLPSATTWSGTYGLPYSSGSSLTSVVDRSYPMTMSNHLSHWSSPQGSLEGGFVPPSVNMRYTTSDWGMNMMSPQRRGGGGGGGTNHSIKDELTDASDYSSEDTCSDYRETLTGQSDYRSEHGADKTRRNLEKRSGHDETMTPDDLEKRRIRRERNKMAAARCRQRRVDLTNQLLAETETLEDERDRLQKEIQSLQRQRAQLEDLLGTHAPRCQSRSMINNNMLDIPPIKAEKYDDYFNMGGNNVYRASCSYSQHPSTTFQSCSRPDTLHLSRRPVSMSAHHNQPSVTNATPSTMTGISSLGLDCMLDGHTGLTPITGAPSVTDHVIRTPVDCGASSGNYSPNNTTTLMTL